MARVTNKARFRRHFEAAPSRPSRLTPAFNDAFTIAALLHSFRAYTRSKVFLIARTIVHQKP